MKTQQEVIDMIRHYERHANDPAESIDQRDKYRTMVEVLKKVLEE